MTSYSSGQQLSQRYCPVINDARRSDTVHPQR